MAADDLLRIGYTPSFIPQTVDYTSRDFQSIRADLIDVVRTRLPEWTGEDPNDFALALVEAFAYMGDLMSYYIDRAGNEAFLPTATRRQSVLNIAQMLGYSPSWAVPSSGTVTFSTEPTYGSTVNVPQYTEVTANVTLENGVNTTITFTTDSAITVPASGGTQDVAVTQGYWADDIATSNHGVVLGASDGSADQEWVLDDIPVAQGTLEIWVYDGVSYTLWNQVDHLVQAQATDNAYMARLKADGSIVVRFGDNVNGRIPPSSHQISAKYRIGGGLQGNVGAGTITSISDPTLDVNLSVTNAASTTGGSDPESTFSIRENAALNYRANQRAVSKQDIEVLANSVAGCSAASANAEVWSNITLAVAPTYDGTIHPGLDGTVGTDTFTGADTSSMTTLMTNVATYLEPLLMAGASLTVRSPDYPRVTLAMTVNLIDSASQAFATDNLKAILLDGPLSFERRGFGGSLTMADIIAAIVTNTSYVTGVTVDDLFRVDSVHSSGVYATDAAWYEILTVDPDTDITFTFVGGIADL